VCASERERAREGFGVAAALEAALVKCVCVTERRRD